MRQSLVVALLALAVLVTACGDDEETPAEGPQGGAIGMQSLQFAPRETTARVGREVVWRNGESVPHNVVATEGADFRSELLQEGQEFRYTPTREGTVQYVCTIHQGMAGTLRVSASG